MGWKGYVRSSIAASNRANKESERRRRQKEKIEALHHASQSVKNFELLIHEITSLHLRCSEKIDWQDFLDRIEPQSPARSNALESKAHLKYDNFKPNKFHKFLKIEEFRKNWLRKNIDKAIKKDESIYKAQLDIYIDEHKEWKANYRLAKQVLRNDIDGFKNALEKYEALKDESYINQYISLELSGDNKVIVSVESSGENLVPKEKLSLRESGSLVIKQMPTIEFYELYKNYVCSCAIRVANEIFAILPINIVIINVTDEILNKSNGHLEKQIILSVFFTKDTLSRMNLKNINPSDSMKNFVHNIEFKKNTGFDAVNSVSLGIVKNL